MPSDGFRLVLDAMTHEERERAEWATGEAGRGKFYCDGFDDGIAAVDDLVESERADAYARGYEDGHDDGAAGRAGEF